ncbi:hypothetical protein D3C72_1939930 [compost metagenome]
MVSQTGDIVNSVRKRAMPRRTGLGGMLWVPRAWRRKPRTMIVRMNEVVMMTRKGRMLRLDSRKINMTGVAMPGVSKGARRSQFIKGLAGMAVCA